MWVRKGGDNRDAKRTPLQQFSSATPAIFRYGRMVVTNSKSCRRVKWEMYNIRTPSQGFGNCY